MKIKREGLQFPSKLMHLMMLRANITLDETKDKSKCRAILYTYLGSHMMNHMVKKSIVKCLYYIHKHPYVYSQRYQEGIQSKGGCPFPQQSINHQWFLYDIFVHKICIYVCVIVFPQMVTNIDSTSDCKILVVCVYSIYALLNRPLHIFTVLTDRVMYHLIALVCT